MTQPATTTSRSRPRGRSPGCYILRDGYEAAAEFIKQRLLVNKGPHVVEIRDDYGVKVLRRSAYSEAELNAKITAPDYIGIYNSNAPIEDIEDDLLIWLRKLPRGEL